MMCAKLPSMKHGAMSYRKKYRDRNGDENVLCEIQHRTDADDRDQPHGFDEFRIAIGVFHARERVRIRALYVCARAAPGL